MSDAAPTSFVQRFSTARDGVKLAMRDYAPARKDGHDLLPVICLPGLSRNSRDFDQLARHLSSTISRPRRVLALDYRGRGRSDWADDKTTYQLPQEAEDVLAVMAALEIKKAVFIGTSRGGLILHILAETQPDCLAGVILNDIGPLIETAGLIGIRQTLQSQLRFDNWEAAISALKANASAAFPALDAQDWHDMAQAIFIETDGYVVSDYDPALTAPLTYIEPGMTLPTLWDSYDRFSRIPLMAIRAEHSTILSTATLKQMAEHLPHLISVIAPGQGHAPLLHKEPLLSAITDFIDAL